MATVKQRPVVAVPTTAALPHSLRLSPNDPLIAKSIGQLPRLALITIVLDWLDEKNQPLCRPYLAEDADNDDNGEDDGDFPAEEKEVEKRWLTESFTEIGFVDLSKSRSV
ncbi:hypothetical protein GP486_002217 [Trichoglossum hirsutum]|uniref:Uncharacterized protein n=1 Tax=Trichoglossum hirsutum TaxID=265104 RepID=A0A9P8LFM4_9PEZI|nr:hypothetical protein GP486_002217 [Trichoglossum hirsutum]